MRKFILGAPILFSLIVERRLKALTGIYYCFFKYRYILLLFKYLSNLVNIIKGENFYTSNDLCVAPPF